eukprot:gene177-303_t
MSTVVINSTQLENKISDVLGATFVRATDMSDGCGSKFEIIIVSERFAGIPLVSQHRLVHGAIDEERKSIHALTLKTVTPETWEKIRDQYTKI